MATHLFAYGTLQFPDVMGTITGRRFPAVAASIEDYGRYALKGRIYPGLRPQPGATTAGVLYSHIDADSLRILDWFEDDGYLRRSVAVTTARGARITADVYLISAGQYHLFCERPWNPERFRRRQLTEFLRRCRQYHIQACAQLGLPGTRG